MGDYIGTVIGVIKRDTRSLDYSSFLSSGYPNAQKSNPMTITWLQMKMLGSSFWGGGVPG